MNTFAKLLSEYDYVFPKSLIAEKPAAPRDSARLLVYDQKTKSIITSTFAHLADFVPQNAVIVFNQTKVLPARLYVTKPSGGKVELLYIRHTPEVIYMLSNKKLAVGTVLTLHKTITFTVQKIVQNEYVLMPSFSIATLETIMEKYGVMPLPPYLRHSKLSEKQRRAEYQTIFGTVPGAVAAPTASLHFTKRLLQSLQKKGVELAFVTLHVGLGTFAPLTEKAVQAKKLHKELYCIDPATAQLLHEAKKQGRPIIAVGTTVVRTLESASNSRGVLTKLSGNTDLFITEKTPLKFVHSLITNFHVPKSSLLMLVAAFIGRKKLLEIYKFAISKKFRLFSFGDGMYIRSE